MKIVNHDIIIFLISLPEPASRGWGEAAGAGHHEPGPAGRGRGQSGGEGQTCKRCLTKYGQN